MTKFYCDLCNAEIQVETDMRLVQFMYPNEKTIARFHLCMSCYKQAGADLWKKAAAAK